MSDQKDSSELVPCEFGGAERLCADAAMVRIGGDGRYFRSEASYRAWFIKQAIEPIVEQIAPGRHVAAVRSEVGIGLSGFRVDVLAELDDGAAFAFELKSANKKNPQTAKYAALQGVGQAILYQELLTALRHRWTPVFLVCDVVDPSLAGMLLRNGLFIGLIEANARGITCFASPRIGGVDAGS